MGSYPGCYPRPHRSEVACLSRSFLHPYEWRQRIACYTTEIAVISLGGIVSNKSIQIAGDDLTDDILNHMRRAHNIKVGIRTAEQIKIHVGSALTELENPPEDYVVHGPNLMTSLPLEVPVSYQEVCHCIMRYVREK